MPGIVGIISRLPSSHCETLVREMVAAMCHEPFYEVGFATDSQLGAYTAWVTLPKQSPVYHPPTESITGIASLHSGELFPDSSTPHTPNEPYNIGSHSDGAIVTTYRRFGVSFPLHLNGLFSGLILDRLRSHLSLFNDRYGFERLYYYQGTDAFYFASEAGALLKVLPQLRSFSISGVSEVLAFGCTLGENTLFSGLRVLPPASLWTITFAPDSSLQIAKRQYFHPSTWEDQPVLPPSDFQERFSTTMRRVTPRYFKSDTRVGIALTGGLDSRMVLTSRPTLEQPPICYTFSGPSGRLLDTKVAAQVADACNFPHTILRLGQDFFTDYANYVDQTVRVSSGGFGLLGAHEIYFNRLARQLSTIRLTGVFGGELMRNVSTFKPLQHHPELLNPDLAARVSALAAETSNRTSHPVTSAAFREIPWSISNSISACRSQVVFRTPFLDTEIVSLLYQMPSELRKSPASAVAFLQAFGGSLATIPTDMGLLNGRAPWIAPIQRVSRRLTFKVDYFCNDGLPGRLAHLDPLIDLLKFSAGVPGSHKFLWYRRWFRRELADYIRKQLDDTFVADMPFWNKKFVKGLADRHIKGQANHLTDINSVLTLAAVQRLML